MLQAKAKGKRGELYLYDAIGEGWSGGVTAGMVAEAIKGLGKVEALDIYVNSPGGSVFEGIAIYNQLRRFDGIKVVHIDALAASIASVIAMAGDERRIAENAMVMIHNPWGMSMGTAEDMRKYADSLDRVRDVIAETYVARAGVSDADARAWMAAETWMGAAEAVARGFATSVAAERDTPAAAASAATREILAKFRNTPKALVAAPRTGIETRGLLARMDMRTRRASPAKA